MTQHTKESLMALVEPYAEAVAYRTITRRVNARAALEAALDEVLAERDTDEAQMREALDALEWEQGGEPCGGQDAINALKRRLKMNGALIPRELLYKALPKKPKEDEPICNPHPKAPHGFNRNASHNAHRYVCDCEGWTP
jgi:hypothetical protein